MNFSITVLGSSSATPTKQRNQTAQILNINQNLYLIDCGEGTQIKIRQLGFNFSKIDNIFISHLHGDHYLGLPGLLFTMHLLGRTKPINLYGPSELEKILNVIFKASACNLLYEIKFHPLQPSNFNTIINTEKIIVKSFPLLHTLPTWGFLFKETDKPRKIKKDFLLQQNVSIEEIRQIKQGADFKDEKGNIYPNNEITIEPPKPRSYAYCSDTGYYEVLTSYIYGVDLLYHEATFMENLKQAAKEKLHSTATEAAQIAKLANVKCLIIGHFSARYKNLNPLLEEAKKIFANTIIAEDNKTYYL